MANKNYKCPVCGQTVKSDIAIKLKNRYLHPTCFNSQMKLIGKEEAKKKQSTKKAASKKPKEIKIDDPVSEEEFAEKKKFLDYFKQQTGEPTNAKIHTLAKKYREQYGFTYVGMYRTLVYCWELKQMPVNGDGIGLIPYYYTEANNFISSYENAKEIVYEPHGEKRTVRIHQPKYTPKTIDITNIEE